MNRERVLSDAKARRWRWSAPDMSLHSRARIFLPPAKTSWRRSRWASHLMRQGDYITEYEVKLATKIAEVLCGGNVTAGTPVSEQYILDLEREGFNRCAARRKPRSAFSTR